MAAHAHSLGASGYIGGWSEDRSLLWQGSYLQHGHAIHLGVDIMAPVGTAILLSGDGVDDDATVIEAWHDPDVAGGWGGRLVLDDDHPTHWLVLAHIEISPDVTEGERVGAASGPIAMLASAERNGGWFPHLHVQRVRRGSDLRLIDGYGTLDEIANGSAPFPYDPWRTLRLSGYPLEWAKSFPERVV